MIDLSQLSPMMQHYMETKKEYPDCVLFYRLGDFYEMFFDDALTVSKDSVSGLSSGIWIILYYGMRDWGS